MSKTIVELARVAGGVVEILQNGEYSPADDVILLCEGSEDSTGVVLLDGVTTRYLTNTQIDTAFLLQKALAVVEQALAVSDSSAYLITATAPIYGKIAGFAPITAELEAIKSELEGHKLL